MHPIISNAWKEAMERVEKLLDTFLNKPICEWLKWNLGKNYEVVKEQNELLLEK